MFNLEQSITEWRGWMRAAGIKNMHVLDELESHFREEVERQLQAGASEEQAFHSAARQIGSAGALKHEFAKAGRRKWSLLTKLEGILAQWFVPTPSLSTFDSSSRHILERARIEAPRLHHNFIGTEHVLLGLLSLEHGAVPNVLKRMNVNRADLRKQIEMWVGIFPSMKMRSNLPYTPRVKKALRLAAKEARDCAKVCVGPEHIFMGLLMEGDGVAARVLKNLGLDIQTVRAEIRTELGGN